jgi:hypothetical protein
VEEGSAPKPEDLDLLRLRSISGEAAATARLRRVGVEVAARLWTFRKL